ncbi:hypothetical protein C8Q80DRAFT_1266487 [Daedaleopsis nitida]|nr:hypothetical protein C8Q80DRAFT_1266487 [Daedaleopsis nitida]
MPRPTGIDRLRAFPRAPAPNDDATAVKSNLSEDDVKLSQNILAYHVAHSPGSKVFGSGPASGLKLDEVWVHRRNHSQSGGPTVGGTSDDGTTSGQRRADELEGVIVCELTVTEEMLNVHGTLAGACAVLVIDFATFASLFALSAVTGVDPSGFSTSMTIVWHAPAVRGMTLRFVGTTLSFKGRVASARCEVYDKEKGTLLVSATHIVAPVQGLPVAGAAKKTGLDPSPKL